MEETKALEQGQKTHPVLIAAGVAVLIFCALGAAALTGILPTATSRSGDPATPQAQAPATPAPKSSPAARPAQPAAKSAAQPKVAAAPCATCGVIQAIQAVQVKGKTSGVGAVAGGVAGGVLGNAVGGGHGAGNAVLTIGGAAGGAFAGDAIEGHMKKQTVWQVTVKLDDGTVRTLQQSTQPPFAVGERVRIVDGKTIERV